MGSSTADQNRTNQLVGTAEGAPAPGAEVVLQRLAKCLAHQVNNALTGVIGYLELSLRDSAAKGNHLSHLNAGLLCARQAAEAVKRLVAFASPEVPTSTLAPVSLLKLAEEAAVQVRTQRGHDLKVEVTGDGDALVLGNEGLLRLALEQIVRNAVEAMSQNGTLTLRREEKLGRVELHVSDTGRGLTAEATAHLFDPFWTSKRKGHLGLGLVLCRDMLDTQDGTLSVASTPGAGTTVTLSLPAARTTDADKPSTVRAPSSGALVPAPV